MRKTKTAICDRLVRTVVVAALILTASGIGQAEPPRQTRKEYALIFITVWSGKDQPAYGVPVKIRPVNEKKARWELVSDHRGECAQRVPMGKQEYVIWADIKTGKGKAKPQTKVQIENDERVDVSLHLTE